MDDSQGHHLAGSFVFGRRETQGVPNTCPMNVFMKRSVFAVVAVFAVVTLSGCSSTKESGEVGAVSSVSDKSAPPTEKEVNKALKEMYETCIPQNEWGERKVDAPSLYGTVCNVTIDRIKQCEADQKAKREQEKQKYEEWEEWSKGKTECNKYRKVAEDKFVSYEKKTGVSSSVGEYTMDGIFTMFNSATGKEEIHPGKLYFDLTNEGWGMTYGGILDDIAGDCHSGGTTPCSLHVLIPR